MLRLRLELGHRGMLRLELRLKLRLELRLELGHRGFSRWAKFVYKVCRLFLEIHLLDILLVWHRIMTLARPAVSQSLFLSFKLLYW